jgi:beta-lactamase regulating signal transducer with metallopeptidase domain
MTSLTVDALVSWIGPRLLVGSVEAVLLVSLVWLACRQARLSASMQATLWWLAALKVVITLLPLPALALPLLPAPVPVIVEDAVADRLPAAAAGSFPDAVEGNAVDWNAIAVSVWLVVVILHAVRLFHQHLAMRRVVRHSVPSGDIVEPLASAIGLRRIPAIRSSSEVDAPQVVGIVRPVVLMPCATIAETDRVMALSHELMHVRRGDLVLGWIPTIAERLFFFHPLVRLVSREYQTAREAACDAAVLQALGVHPGEYGRLLMRFGVAPRQPVFVAGGASTSMSSLRRRLIMLQQSSSNGSRRIGWALGALMLLTMIPIQLVAQAPANRSVRLQADPSIVSPLSAVDDARRVVSAPSTALRRAQAPSLSAREQREATEESMRQRLEEARQRLQDMVEAARAARTDQEGAREAGVESMRKSIEQTASASRAQAEREVTRAAREVNQAIREAGERARQVEREKAIDQRTRQLTSQPEFTVQQLDSVRRTIEQLDDQIKELRKLEQRLREELSRK